MTQIQVEQQTNTLYNNYVHVVLNKWGYRWYIKLECLACKAVRKMLIRERRERINVKR